MPLPCGVVTCMCRVALLQQDSTVRNELPATVYEYLFLSGYFTAFDIIVLSKL